MTNHRVGKTNTKDPRGGWRGGKRYKTKGAGGDSTTRYLRRAARQYLRHWVRYP